MRKKSNAGLQLRRAISIQAEGKKLLQKNAIPAVSCKALFYERASREKNNPTCWPSFLWLPAPQRNRKPCNSRRQGSFLPSSPQQLLEIFSERPRPDFILGSADHCFI